MMFKRALLLVMCLAMAAGTTSCKKNKAGKGVRGSDSDSLIIGSGEDLGMLDGGGMLAPRMEGDMTFIDSSAFEPVFFAYDSSNVNASERGKIDALADYLRSNGNTGVVVEGHCDERGSREYNLSLGERRALAIRAYLVGLGIDASRIQTKSYGEENPAAFGHDESSWSQNRRGEFSLFN